MNICKLTISYDRGVSLNKPDDLVLEQDAEHTRRVAERGHKTADGKVLRGLGSHFRSEADAELVKQRDFAAREIYQAFRKTFLAAPIEGLYFVPERGQAKAFIAKLDVREDMRVSVSEFELTAPSDLEQAEMAAWGKRIQNQLSSISLGRSKEADEAGLSALVALAGCPVLQKGTADRIRELVSMVRDGRLERVEVKRSLDKLIVNVNTETLSPRRTPKIAEEVA
jgi:hypothetical protein